MGRIGPHRCASLGWYGRDRLHGAGAGPAHQPVRDRGCSQHRQSHQPTLRATTVTEEVLAKIRGLKTIADEREQSLAQMALAWVLRDPVVASTLIGASSVAQLDENLGALDNLDFSEAELTAIEGYATDAGIDIWRSSSDL